MVAEASARSLVIGPFRALDHLFSITVPGPALGAHLDGLFGALAVPDGGATPVRYEITASEDHHRLLCDGAPVLESDVPGAVVGHLVWHVNASAVQATRHRLFLIHAAAAAGGERALVLPGASGAGKSTLVAGLVRRGLAYLTDEATGVDPADGRIERYPKPINLERGSWEVLADLAPPRTEVADRYDFGEWLVDPRTIRADAVGVAATPAAVVFPVFHAGAAADLVPVGRAEAAVALIAHSFNADALGPVAFDTAVDLVRGCACYRLTFGNLDEACDALDSVLRP